MKFNPRELSARTITIFVLALLALIVVLQNWTGTGFEVLFIEVKMPRIVFFGILLGIGFALGLLYKGRKGK